MNAENYRARAEEMLRCADAAVSYSLILTFEQLAVGWLTLAESTGAAGQEQQPL